MVLVRCIHVLASHAHPPQLEVRLCLDCATAYSPGDASRCPGCVRKRDARRNSNPKRKAYSDPAYQAIALVGPCADAHLGGCAGDLTRDHVPALVSMPPGQWRGRIEIRCRHHNSSKGALP